VCGRGNAPGFPSLSGTAQEKLEITLGTVQLPRFQYMRGCGAYQS
jgi:hypothetical protein